MTRTARAIEIATALVAARADVVRLEAELEDLFEGRAPAKARIDSRGTQPARPGRRSRKEAPQPTSQPELADGGAALPSKAKESLRGRRAELVRLWNDDGVTDPHQLAKALAIDVKQVRMDLWRARKAGQLPKAVASR